MGGARSDADVPEPQPGYGASDRKWVGHRVRRVEDPRFLTGRGRYVADLGLPRMLHLAVVRSGVSHARIRSIRGADLTAADLPAWVRPLPVLYQPAGTKAQSFPVLPRYRVRYVGQPVGALVGEDRYRAEDRAEAVEVAYEPLPCLVDVEEAAAGRVLLYPKWGDNIACEQRLRRGDPEAAFAAADGGVRLRLRFGRSQGMPIEGRGILADWDAGRRRLTVWLSTQVPHQIRMQLADILSLAESQVRVLVPDVGGGFGNKLHLFPEEVLACVLARTTGRPVRWIEDRHEHLVGMVHARDQVLDVRAAYRADGRVTALAALVLCDAGAHLHSKGCGPLSQTLVMLPGPYRIEDVDLQARSVVTNKTPNGAYRGFGQPEATFAIERVMDAVAGATGLDPVAVRRRNLVRRLPHTTAAGLHLDSGDYLAALDRCVELARAERSRGAPAAPSPRRKRGMGFSICVERTGFGPSAAMMKWSGQSVPGYETVRVRVDQSGRVVVSTGLTSQGQGHETVFAQIVAEVLGVPLDRVSVLSGDSDRDPFSGFGTAGSRGGVVGAAGVLMAARRLRRQVLSVAASVLEARPEDLTLDGGGVRVRGTPGLAVAFDELARRAYRDRGTAQGDEPGLEARAVYEPRDWTYGYCASAAEVEVDLDTLEVRLCRYVMVHDSGTVLNPAVAEGQLIGGVAQGIGGAMMEEHVYDPGGVPLTGSLMDYLLPCAADVPRVHVVHLETPSPVTPGGSKGLGEAGVIAPAPAIVQAIEDALGRAGIAELPVSPFRLWAAAAGRPAGSRPDAAASCGDVRRAAVDGASGDRPGSRG